MTDHDDYGNPDYNEPYTTLQRVADAVFNFLVALGVIAFSGISGYLWAMYL